MRHPRARVWLGCPRDRRDAYAAALRAALPAGVHVSRSRHGAGVGIGWHSDPGHGLHWGELTKIVDVIDLAFFGGCHSGAEWTVTRCA